MNKVIKSFFTRDIVLILSAAFLVRLVFSLLPSFSFDMGAWLAWAQRMTDLGPAGFYSDDVWTQYTPLYLYWLWAGGLLGLAGELWVKVPVILADIATGLFIYKFALGHGRKFAVALFLLYVLNPVVIFTGSVWGQIDGILALSLLAASYFVVSGKKPVLAGLVWALAFLLKPQAVVFLAPFVFMAFAKKYKVKDYLEFFVTAGATLILVSLPFFPNDPTFGLPNLVSKMTAHYNYTSVFAFNLWSIVGMWQEDSAVFLGISYYLWGVMFYLLAIFAIFWRFKNKLAKEHIGYLVFALCFLASFLFPTRVHERYLFPMFAFLLVSVGLAKSRFLIAVYLALSVLNFLNLYHPYAYYSENFLKSETLLSLTGALAVPVAVVSIIIFISLIFFHNKEYKLISSMVNATGFAGRTIELWLLSSKKELTEDQDKFPKVNLRSNVTKYLLIGVLAFAFFTRVLSLAHPPAEYFDEVYHAFTAREMLHGNPAAWEWWNTPPEGFAYEWTHPPIAKLMMVGGMAIFGENSFSWRFPGAILGVVSVYLVYLLAKIIFKDDLLGVIAAGVFSLDGLALVLSRIGMNDIYLLTFCLASLYFFLKNRNFLAAVFFGLAVSSKWSAIWLIPILLMAHFVFKKKLKVSYLWMFILPPLIYMASYIPFFAQGHSFEQFINVKGIAECVTTGNCQYTYGLQEQMWYYHTRLEATHSYTSPWWSWPLNMRPVYLYTSEELGNMVSRIYLIGNPFVFWSGLASVIFSFLYSLKTKNKKLLFIGLAYLVFFTPWALSPRIMFLYHYFPSVPFMAIALAYVLRKFPNLILVVLPVIAASFLYFYPHWAGLWVPLPLDMSYYWFSSWR